ncbi:MAG: DUF3109 family protein [Alphaproteobacteria bacterium]|nr:DUF3109 family protein [Alphaproteobacteria bacterium]
MSDERILRKHRLKHISELRVSDELLEVRFRAGCSMSSCRAECCGGGADIDLGERDRVLENADLVRSLMDRDQEHDTARWFEDFIDDADFPSGHAVTTRTHNDRCVFLNAKGLCVLQIAEGKMAQGETLKPFFCRAFPICLNEGELTYDDQFETEPQCCSPVADGDLTIFDVCAFELEYVLGAEGAAELREMLGL